MAHVKTGGGKANQGSNVPGKRRGVKRFANELVKSGEIIVRQKGTKFYPGVNTGIGRDFTIYSKVEGIVKFRRLTKDKRDKFAIDIIPK
jgi:large subunit ribosomal protein L27